MRQDMTTMEVELASQVTAAASRRSLNYARAFYALVFGANVFLSPFLSLYYSELGFTGRQIGVLRGVAPLVAVVCVPLWGALADLSGRHRLLRLIAIAGSWLAVVGIARTTGYAALIGLVVVYTVFFAPVVPLVDNAVLTMLGKRRDDYGKLRLWGAVGWGTGAIIAGMLADRFGLIWSFVGYLVVSAGTGLSTLGLPAGQMQVQRGIFAADLRRLLADSRWRLFLLVILVGTLYQTISMHYLFIYFDALGIRKSLMGLGLVFATLGELPVWALAPRMLRRWGPRRLIAMGFAAAAVQGLVYASLPPTWLALGIQVLHGLVFPAMWAGGIAYVARVTPEGVRATAQGIFSITVMGLSSTVGALLGGWLFDEIGGARTFGLAGLVALVAAGLIMMLKKTNET
jgi:MFS transporter, PPP family, 3-phenylpropionic acid transporter